MRTIYLAEYGILPGRDITLEVNRLFKTYPRDTVFEFEKGDYYLSPKDALRQSYCLSNTDSSDYKTLGLWMKNMSNCTIRGNGARLWFAGHMQPFTIDSCSGIQIQDFKIDWEKPMVAEGIVTEHGNNWVELYIDGEKFPHRYRNNWLEFDVGAGEWYPLRKDFSCIQYDADTLCIRKNTGDTYPPLAIEKERENLYKFITYENLDAVAGNIFVLRHNMRLHAGIFMENSRDVSVERVTIHSCGGLGCLSQFCHNVRFRKVDFVPNTELGRKVVNGRDDGMHITSNSGTVEITECNFIGLMDDPINVHGCCVAVDAVVDDKTVRCSYRHDQAKGFLYWARPDDRIAFIDRKNMTPLHQLNVQTYRLESQKNFILSFQEKIPEEILELCAQEEGIALENMTNTPEFICTKNRFGSCRARGLLVSTPRPVRIEENYFESSGSAVLIAGDSNYWFESGACHDVTIQKNVFTNKCNSSYYEFCEGVISICPVIPEPEENKPFHTNIRICDNVFDVEESRLLYAFSCRNLVVKDNLIFKNRTDCEQEQAGSVKLEYCSDVEICNKER